MTNREWSDGFALRLSEAEKRGATRAEIAQAIVEAAAEWVGAMSAAYYEREADGRLCRYAVAGLFPPQTIVAGAMLEEFSTRARRLEFVLRGPEHLSGDSLVAQVAESGRAELIAEATEDARIVAHTDSALTVRSIIFVPVLLRGTVRGVLVVANSVSGGAFTSEDFARFESLAILAATALPAPALADAKDR